MHFLVSKTVYTYVACVCVVCNVSVLPLGRGDVLFGRTKDLVQLHLLLVMAFCMVRMTVVESDKGTTQISSKQLIII